MLNIQIIVGSTRPGRLAKNISNWLMSQIDDYKDVKFEIVDIADYSLPLLDEPIPAGSKQYSQEHTRQWAEKISQADGFIFVTPEYNHGTSATLKNAIDFLYHEWKYKPVAFLGYGSIGGVRAIEQLIGVTVAVNMFPLRDSVHIFEPWVAFDERGNVKPELLKGDIKTMIDPLVRVAIATKQLRTELK